MTEKTYRKLFTERITVLLTKDQKEALVAKAKKSNRKPSDIIRAMINMYLGQ